MRHEIFDRFLLHGFPGPGDGKDKAPAACRIGFIAVFDHGHVGFGTIGGITAHDHQLCPTRGHKFAYHLAKQGIFTAITGVALGQNEPKAHRHAIAVPRRHQQHEAQAKKPGMILADTPFLDYGIFRAAFVGMAPVAKQIQYAIGRRWQGGQDILSQPADDEMYVPVGGFE
jgi:hypothetical protein